MKTTHQESQSKVPQAPMKASPEVVEALRLVLSDTFVLYMKTYAVHWNYQGNKFFSVHKLTEEHYEQLAEAIDEIAERIRALGEIAPISLETILEKSDLQEIKRSNASDDSALIDLVSGHALLSKRAHETAELCGNIGDIFSQDIMIRRIGQHDKAAWMLRSFLKGSELKTPERVTHS